MDLSVTTVPAVHSNGVSGDLIGGKLGDMLDAVGLTAYAGPATGYVLTFSNGLVVYLSGATASPRSRNRSCVGTTERSS